MNPNLQAVANGASSRLILNPDPLLGARLTQTLLSVYIVPQWLRKTAVPLCEAQSLVHYSQYKAAVDRSDYDTRLCTSLRFLFVAKRLGNKIARHASPLVEFDSHTRSQGLQGRLQRLFTSSCISLG